MVVAITCDNPFCPVFGVPFTQMTVNDGSCGVCGKTPKVGKVQ